jgi:hypothetical protein
MSQVLTSRVSDLLAESLADTNPELLRRLFTKLRKSKREAMRPRKCKGINHSVDWQRITELSNLLEAVCVGVARAIPPSLVHEDDIGGES